MWLKLIANKYVVGAAGLLACLFLIWVYGRYEYSRGSSNERINIERQQREIAQAQQEETDRREAQWRGQVLATQQREKDLAVQLAGTADGLRKLRKQLQTAGTCPRLDDSGEDWIGILGESWAEYSDMAKEAGRLSDKVTGLQGYIKGVKAGQTKPR